MDDCIFCQIAKGKTQAHKVHEDEHTVAFLDIHPLAEGHTLVIPKQHAAAIQDIHKETLAHVTHAAQDVAKLLEKKLGAHGVNILNASGLAAQQSVPHFHLHVVPRFDNDKHNLWPKTHYKGDLAATAKRLQ